MSWVRLGDTFGDRPCWDELGAQGLALHVCALGFSNRHVLNGRLSVSAVRRLFGIDDVLGVADSLVKAGLWLQEGDEFVIVADLDDQLSPDEELNRRENAKVRAKRHRRHRDDE